MAPLDLSPVVRLVEGGGTGRSADAAASATNLRDAALLDAYSSAVSGAVERASPAAESSCDPLMFPMVQGTM